MHINYKLKYKKAYLKANKDDLESIKFKEI